MIQVVQAFLPLKWILATEAASLVRLPMKSHHLVGIRKNNPVPITNIKNKLSFAIVLVVKKASIDYY